jgi:hypothetical protein
MAQKWRKKQAKFDSKSIRPKIGLRDRATAAVQSNFLIPTEPIGVAIIAVFWTNSVWERQVIFFRFTSDAVYRICNTLPGETANGLALGLFQRF